MTPAFAAAPANIDSGLQKLVFGTGPKTAATLAVAKVQTLNAGGAHHFALASGSPGRFDASGRVLVHVQLDGTSTAAKITAAIVALKGSVTATNSTYNHGILAAYLPISQIVTSAAIPGVRALTLEHTPQTHAGKVTSQGTSVLRTGLLGQHGIDGTGVTVGVLSDSFNTAYETANPPATTAAQDVASGDLPVVNVLEDFPYGTDEGRAMCQIIHDEAPKAKIAFATADDSEIGFANNIVALRTQANASVITDDVGYFDEPVFSDGLVSQAVNAVATSTTLPGHPVTYTSSAGNDGNNAYRSEYRNLSDATVRKAGNHGNLKLISDPTSPNYLDPSLTAGGWFNWNVNGGSEPSTVVGAPGPSSYGYAIFMQWDDLFDQDHGITTNYNFLVFDQDGNYLPYLSSTTSAFSIQEPIQAIGYLALGTNYQIAITATTQKDPKAGPIPAKHHIALYTDLDGASTLQGTYFKPAPLSVPNIIGHPTADGAIATAAYAFSYRWPLPFRPELENFTSPGPATFYFDQNYQRLTTPIVRTKPEVAGVDGVITTFFGAPYYNYPFAFFGTSAAAPSVAGVAALMTQAAGGPGKLNPAFAKAALEASTTPRNSTVESTQAFGASSAGYLTVTALGQSYFPNYMTAHYFGPAGDSIQQITIDGTAAGLVFDADYFAVTSATGIDPASITVSPATGTAQKITLLFKKGTFSTGASIGFELGQDVTGTWQGYTQDEYGNGVEAEDLSYGATVTVQYNAPKNPCQTLPFQIGYPNTSYSPADGFGLIDAPTAVGFVAPCPYASVK